MGKKVAMDFDGGNITSDINDTRRPSFQLRTVSMNSVSSGYFTSPAPAKMEMTATV
jgi:hypothetical protein